MGYIEEEQKRMDYVKKRERPRYNRQLRGKGWISVAFFLTIIRIPISFVIGMEMSLFAIILSISLVDLLFVYLCYKGFSKGKQGWATFAIIYSIITGASGLFVLTGFYYIYGLFSGPFRALTLFIGGIIGSGKQ
ncbi:MAG: hypothetical protein ACOCV8_05620 [Spirochaetota bacterium]